MAAGLNLSAYFEDVESLFFQLAVSKMMKEFWTEIRIILNDKFNTSELKNVIFDNDINQNNLDSQTAADLAREILLYVDRSYDQQAQREFVDYLKKKRPHADWPDWPKDHQVVSVDSPQNREAQPKPAPETTNLKSHPAAKPKGWNISPITAGLTSLAFVLSIWIVYKVATPSIEIAEADPQTITVEEPIDSVLPTTEPTSEPADETTTLLLEPTTSPITITTTESVKLSEPVPTHTPSPVAVSEEDLAQIEVLSKTGLFTQPDAESPRLRFVDVGEILTVSGKNENSGFDWLYVKKDGEYWGWLKIKHIQKANEFSYATVPTNSNTVGSNSPTSSSSDDATDETTLRSKLGVSAQPTCDVQVWFEYTPSSDYEIHWSTLPQEAGYLSLSVNRILPPEDDLIPLVQPNHIDQFAMERKVFNFPRTRFSERGYEPGNSFEISLRVFNTDQSEICAPATSTFSWDGRK